MKQMNYPSNFQVIFPFVLHIILFATILFGTIWLLGGKFEKNLLKVGEGGKQLIAFGFPFMGLVLLIFNGVAMDHFLIRKFGNNAAGYISAGTILSIFPIGIIWDKCIPRKITIPLGITSYMFSCLIVGWKAIH